MPDYTRSRWFTEPEPYPSDQWAIWDEAGVACIALVQPGVMPDPTGEANARAIVRAVNREDAFDALLAELKRLEWWDEYEEGYRECRACLGIHLDDEGSGHRPGCTLAAALAVAEPPGHRP